MEIVIDSEPFNFSDYRILAKNHGNVIGAIDLVAGDGGELVIAEIGVDQQYQRQGVAEKMLREAEELARQKGFSRLLSRVSLKNFPSIELHKKLGAKPSHSDPKQFEKIL